MSDYLPPTVLPDILSRLPVKTLIRFRCVSKSWCALISSPNFIDAHLLRNRNNTHLLLRYLSLSPKKKEHYSLLSHDAHSFHELTQLHCPFKTRTGNFFRIIGSCNGLICLSDDCFGYTYTTIIWNPAIRKYVTLPMPRVCYDSYGPYAFALGFGFDSISKDHKVVRIAHLKGDDGVGYVLPPEVEVYSLSTGVWRTVSGENVPYSIVEHFWSTAFVNGAVHWMVYNRNDAEEGGFCNRILAFDMSSEVFREIQLPNQMVHENPLDLSVAACGDILSVFRYSGRMRGQFCERCAVWVMKEYGVVDSWSKQFFADLQGGISAVLGFRKSGGEMEMLLEKGVGSLVSYHSGNNEIKDLKIHGGKDSFYVGSYGESLVLLEAENGVLGGQLKSCDAADSEDEPVLTQMEQLLEEYGLVKNSVAHMLFAKLPLQ